MRATKRMLYGGGAAAALAAAYVLGSVTLGGAFAQTPPGTEQQDQQPGYTSSITVPPDRTGQQGRSEQDEAQALAGQAKITGDQAKAAALSKFPGATVHAVALENENGALVYGVELTDAAGKGQDVKVDAGNAAVLHVEAGGEDGPEASEIPAGVEAQRAAG